MTQQRERSWASRWTTGMRNTLGNPRILLGVVVMIALGIAISRARAAYRPVIHAIPVVAPGENLTLLGSGFGARQGDSYLDLLGDGRRVTVRDTIEWSNRKIVIAPPGLTGDGRVRVLKRTPLGHWASKGVPFVSRAAALPSQPYGYEVPVAPEAPWPLFRRDRRNTGRSPVPATYQGDRPWSFQTGKGIFSTPVIDGAGTVYIGSADHTFYALNPDGSLKWNYTTGEIIDSAAALPRQTPGAAGATILVPSGDGYLYCLRTDAASDDPGDRVQWTFDARVSPRASYNNWFEGNVALGFDGTIYAGNTNFNYYAITPEGGLKWTYETGANSWSMAGLGDDGTIFWASVDTLIRAVRPDGVEKWTTRTLGFVAASAAIGSDGTVYIGSFDSYFYALDPRTGEVQWTFKTDDHIYSSAALGADAAGNTNAIYVSSTDGIVYALTPEGALRWKYDTGEPIRSSPVLGADPDGAEGQILYFGSGNGKLYALNASDGTRRWSFDTTAADPERRDRNDLNASPALGRTGVYIGGEHGQVWYVPYDYCLNAEDARCRTHPGEDLPDDLAGLYYVTPGGSLAVEPPATLTPATIVTLRLMVRKSGESVAARLCDTPLLCGSNTVSVRIDPPVPFQVEKSADGQYLHIMPTGLLTPGQAYTLRVDGDYFTGGHHIGNLTIGGDRAGRFQGGFTFRVEESEVSTFPLAVGPDAVSAFEWTRLALPIPTMMPSLNQIGFDYMDWIIGAVDIGAPGADGTGTCVLWAIGAHRDETGTLVAGPQTDFRLPLSGVYRGSDFLLANRDFTMAVTGIPITFNRYEMRGRFGPDLAVRPGATAYADTGVLSIPTFGPYLVLAGLANNVYEKLIVSGTYVTRPYDARGSANKRPQGVAVSDFAYTAPTDTSAGQIVATLRLDAGAHLPASAHLGGLVLVDSVSGDVVPLNYHEALQGAADAQGDLTTITLTLPAGKVLPVSLKAIVLVDVFPIHVQILGA